MAKPLMRQPMLSRTNFKDIPIAPVSNIVLRKSSGAKRPHSEETSAVHGESEPKAKRSKAVEPVILGDEKATREQRRAARNSQRAEFREKYTQAFPGFVFYFDTEHLDPDVNVGKDSLKFKVHQLGGHVDHFFSSSITHLITNQPVPTNDENKENHKPQPPLGVVPMLVGRLIGENSAPTFNLVEKAIRFNIKIWSQSKLDGVLRCCLPPSLGVISPHLRKAHSAKPAPYQPSLAQLLEKERLQGTTSERDPTARRHDYRYFSPRSYFVLVEDMRSEIATVAAHEWDRTKVNWPVLHCDPYARGPFLERDERDKKRVERINLAVEVTKRGDWPEPEPVRLKAHKPRGVPPSKGGDLKRSVSMTNVPGRTSKPFADRTDNVRKPESIKASGYLASGSTFGYTAASGNSVGITSTTGTTSTTHYGIQPLPPALRGLIENHVVTSRKVSAPTQNKRDAVRMGPPEVVPDRPHPPLRKSKSTNTIRLPGRDEGTKPGYCEPCRVKFDESYQEHIQTAKHRKYAMNTTRFANLDTILARLRRPTFDEVPKERFLDHALREGGRGVEKILPPSPSKRNVPPEKRETEKGD